MMKIITKCSVFVLVMLFSVTLYGQVDIGGTSYARLSLAFNAINAGTHTGDIVIKITDDFTESSTAILQASGTGSADYNSIVIYPTGTRKIQGNLSNGIIQLQGADNVTIDGRINLSGSDRGLTIKNNATSGTIIRIDSLTSGNPANYNKVQYCNIEHSSKTSTYGVTFGTSSSYSGSASHEGNEVAYNSFKYLYQGIRVYSVSGREVLDCKIYGNTFGSSNLSQTVSYQPIYIYYTDGIEIYDNIFEYLDYTSTIYTMYIYYSKNASVYNNTIRNVNHISGLYGIYMYYCPDSKIYGNTIDNFKTGGAQCYPIYIYHSSQTAYEVYGNTVNNVGGTSTFYGIYIANGQYSSVYDNSVKNVSNSSTTYGYMLSSCPNITFKNNAIDNLVCTGSSSTYGAYFSSCSSSEILNNRFTDISSGTSIYGIYGTSCTSSKFNNNLLDNFSSIGTSTTAAIGFYIASCNSSEFVNNSISRMTTTQFSSSSTTSNPFGFLITGGSGYKFYFNSVNLTGKQINVGTQGTLSACLMLTTTSINSLDIKNNNFYNDIEGLPGSRSYAIYFQSTSNLSSSSLNYNNYYTGGMYSRFAYMSGEIANLSTWKSATSQEANSNNLYPDFNSNSVLAPFIGAAILGKGTPISGYGTDINGVTRSNTNPTPGAYEEADDIVGPESDFSPLKTTTSTANRNIVLTMTDRSGINMTSDVPKIYFRKASSTNEYNGNTSSTPGWKYNDGIRNGNEFTFVIDYSKLQGGATEGDDIEYFIIAQDVASKKNISITSGKFAQTPTSTNLTNSNFPVISADSYKLAVAVVGNYNVGNGQTFTSLTKPDGMFKYLNDNVITGDVFINITSNLTETNEVELRKLNYEAGIFKVTIRPSTSTERIIQGDIPSSAIIRIIGADNVVIDGSYDGKGRYLSFTNTTTTSPRAVLMVGTASGTGGNNITIQNSNIYMSSSAATSVGIITSDGAVTTSPTANNMNNLTIKNNWIYRCQYGIIARGGTSTGSFLYNLLIENNLLGNDNSTDAIFQYGMDVQYAMEGVIRGNKVWNMVNTASNKAAIQFGNPTSLAGRIICENNKIWKIRYTSTGGWGAWGINVLSGYNHLIRNNFISDIKTDRYSLTSTTYNPFGIRIAGGYNLQILSNTVVMDGVQEATNTVASLTANILISSSSYTGMDIRGNILHNSLQGISGTRSFNIFIYSDNVGSAFSNLDHNVYSVGGAAGVVGGFGTSSPFTEGYNLSQWRSWTGRDQNSKEGMPEFVDTETNVHLNGSSIGNSYFMYNGLPEITTDGDGEIRNSTTYYGADEINAIFELVEDTKITPSNAVQCVGDASTVSFNPDIKGFGDGVDRSGLSSIDIQWYKNGQPIIGANKKNITFNPVEMKDSARYYAHATFMGKTVVGSEKLLKVEEAISIAMQPMNTDVCSTNPELIMPAVAAGTILGYQWEFRKPGTSTWVDVQGQTSPTINRTINASLIGDYRLRVMGPGNCGPATFYSDPAIVYFSEPLKNVNLHQVGKVAGKDLKYTCVGEDITLNVTDEGTVFGYRWQRDAGQGFVDLSLAQYPTAHSATLVMVNSNPGENGTYRCKVLGSASCGTAEVFSQEVVIKIWPYFSLDEQPVSRTLCVGESSFTRVNISGTIYSYQWYRDGKMLTAEDSEFYNKPVFYFDNAQYSDAGVYQCRVQAEDCFGFLDFMSEPASINVITSTDITLAPISQAVMIGGDVNFRVRAHVNGSPDNYVPELQWYRGNEPLVEGGRFIGTKSDRLMITNVQESDFANDYRVVVIGKCGFAEANNIALIKGEITIIEQPQSIDVCENDNITLSVKASTTFPDMNLTYQWFREGIALVDGVDGMSGVNTPDLFINNATPNLTGNYYAVVKPMNSVYGLSTVEATVNIEAKPLIITEPQSTISLESGKALTLSVGAQGSLLNYQWFFNGEAIVGETTNTLEITNVSEANSGQYYVEITNACGNVKSIISEVTITTTTTDVTDNQTNGYSLGMIAPNPVNHISNMSYTLPADSYVKISIVNELGVEISVLANEFITAGTHNISIDSEALNLTSGAYSVVFKSANVVLARKIIVIK